MNFLKATQGRYGVDYARNNRADWPVAVAFTVMALFSAAPADAQVRISALGDSLTQGYGLEVQDGLVPQLQAWLDAQGVSAVVLNAGVSGDTTQGGLSRLDWTLGDDPEAMIVALGGNDLLRGLDPAISRANLDAILTRLKAEGIPALLVGLAAPGNYGPDYQAAFDAMYVDLAAQHGALLVPHMLEPIADALDGGADPRRLMQADMIHPSPEGVALVVQTLGPQVAALVAQVQAGS